MRHFSARAVTEGGAIHDVQLRAGGPLGRQEGVTVAPQSAVERLFPRRQADDVSMSQANIRCQPPRLSPA
jgi:hypothetical protein